MGLIKFLNNKVNVAKNATFAEAKPSKPPNPPSGSLKILKATAMQLIVKNKMLVVNDSQGNIKPEYVWDLTALVTKSLFNF